MKISILTPDLSNNCLGRAYLLAKILQRHYEVEIIGPDFGDGIWKPVADDKSISIKSVKMHGRLRPYWKIRELAKNIDGDVIYASKPLLTSFGVGLLKKFTDKKPLILDIDDWQMGFMKDSYSNQSLASRFRSLVVSALFLYRTGSYWNNLVCEKLAHFANEITVSNSFLQRKFGGEIISHARDTKIFNPDKFDKSLIRKRYKIEDTKKIVMFFGSPRPHKGIEDLIKAITLIKNPNIILVIIGVDCRDPYCQKLVETAKNMLGKKGIISFGLQPFERVPEFLAMADIVVIPQKRNFATEGQLPAKVFDAMAMAKPIIASNVSDLPEILNGCGWIIEPGNPEHLAEAIQYVFNYPEEAVEMGGKARGKCIEKYSWDALENVLVDIFCKYE